MKHRKTNYCINICDSPLLRLFLIVLMSIVGCSVPQPNSQVTESPISDVGLTTTVAAPAISPTATMAPLVIRTQTATTTPSPPATLTAAAIVTPYPLATSTATSAPTLTLTPLPTISPQERGEVYTELMNNNGNCELPCWWGIKLSMTRAEYIEQLYTSLGASITTREFESGISRITTVFVDPQIEYGTQIPHAFRIQDGIVIEALVHASGPNYHIEPLLQRLGQPSEVWMWTIPEPYQGILPTRFRLYFPEQGVFVLYATGGVKVDDNVQVCFDELGGVTLLLWDPAIWDPDGTKGVIDRSNEGGTAFTLEGFSIEDVSNWTVEELYTILTNPTHTECLETPSNIWSSP